MNQGLVLGVLVGMSLLLFLTTQVLLDERSKHAEAAGRYEELRLALESERSTKKLLEQQLVKLQDGLLLQVASNNNNNNNKAEGENAFKKNAEAKSSFAETFRSNWQGDPRPPMTWSFIKRVRYDHPILPYYPTRNDLVAYFHYGDDPYAGLGVGENVDFAGGYVSYAERTSGLITEAVHKLLGGPPRFMIEVGSFVGSSIVHVWAPLVKLHPKGVMLSIDTWLGDVNMRVLGEFKRFLQPVHGVPTLAHHMMRRMVFTNNTDVVIPLPLSSIVAARALSFCGFIIDLIYVDSAHEKGETYAELVLYFQLLRVGGLLCGDDYHGWPAVKHDVDLFAASVGAKLIHLDGEEPVNPRRPEGGQWCIQKKGSSV